MHNVVCVVKDASDFSRKDTYVVADYCAANQIRFVTRVFSPQSDDSKHVLRLPAYHLYKGHDYMETFYQDGDPIKHIMGVIYWAEPWSFRGVLMFWRRLCCGLEQKDST